MIECPWCYRLVEVRNGRCPICKEEIYVMHENVQQEEADKAGAEHESLEERSIEELIVSRFKCSKCSHSVCRVQEVAMSGTGLSKMLDIEHHHYLFVSCMNCGFVEVYNPDILLGKKAGAISTVMDVLFGG